MAKSTCLITFTNCSNFGREQKRESLSPCFTYSAAHMPGWSRPTIQYPHTWIHWSSDICVSKQGLKRYSLYLNTLNILATWNDCLSPSGLRSQTTIPTCCAPLVLSRWMLWHPSLAPFSDAVGIELWRNVQFCKIQLSLQGRGKKKL